MKSPLYAWVWKFPSGEFGCLIHFDERHGRRINGKDGPKRGRLICFKLTEIKTGKHKPRSAKK